LPHKFDRAKSTCVASAFLRIMFFEPAFNIVSYTSIESIVSTSQDINAPLRPPTFNIPHNLRLLSVAQDGFSSI
jgi:hypothetical protein